MIDYEGDRSEVLERELQAWDRFVESAAVGGRLDWGPGGDDQRFMGLLGLIYDRFVDPNYAGSKEALTRVFAKHEDGARVVDRIDRFFRTRIEKPAEPAPDDTIIALAEQIKEQRKRTEPHRHVQPANCPHSTPRPHR